MNRRGFLLALAGAAASGVALSTQAQAAPAGAVWDDLQAIEAGGEALDGDLPAEGATEAQRHGRGRASHGHRAPRGRYYGRRRAYYPRGRAYGYYHRPRYRRYRRRVCRRAVNRYGYVVRRCYWVW